MNKKNLMVWLFLVALAPASARGESSISGQDVDQDVGQDVGQSLGRDLDRNLDRNEEAFEVEGTLKIEQGLGWRNDQRKYYKHDVPVLSVIRRHAESFYYPDEKSFQAAFVKCTGKEPSRGWILGNQEFQGRFRLTRIGNDRARYSIQVLRCDQR